MVALVMSTTMPIAITRAVSPAIGQCELTHLERQPIDVQLAVAQHQRYCDALTSLGCAVLHLPAEPALPDSVFVEDTAIVLDDIAIITRPGAAARRAETASIAQALAPYRRLVFIEVPGLVDGGDVLRLDKTLYVGLSTRSNQAAIDQMRTILTPLGYTVQGVLVEGCLHLKSAVTQVGPQTLLVNPRWVDAESFGDWQGIEVDPAEPYGANALWVQGAVIYPTSYPRTAQRLIAAGIPLVTVEAGELIKAEGAVTCCSLILT
jgi:dimethylargininase